MIIFLDIDGVLCIGKYAPNRWDPVAVLALTYLISKLDAQLVISSDWRRPEHQKLLEDRLEEFRLTTYLHKDKFTPILVQKMSEDCIRGREIETWINNNNYTGEYLILDDVYSFYPEQKKNVYITNSKTGLRPRDAIKILEQLGKSDI